MISKLIVILEFQKKLNFKSSKLKLTNLVKKVFLRKLIHIIQTIKKTKK